MEVYVKRRIGMMFVAALMMAAMMMTAAAGPALADHLELGPVLCDDVLTDIPENPPFCVVDPSSIPSGESFQCDNVVYEIADVTGPFCVVDGGIELGYLIPLGT